MVRYSDAIQILDPTMVQISRPCLESGTKMVNHSVQNFNDYSTLANHLKKPFGINMKVGKFILTNGRKYWKSKKCMLTL